MMLRVLFLIESKPFQYDNRARAQVEMLRQTGSTLAVISPAEEGDPLYACENGIHLYRYRKPSYMGIAGHVIEYLVSVFWQSLLALVVLFRHGFNVIEVTNPPDILWIVAAPYRLLGKRIIFDHQDPVPELFQARYGDNYKVLSLLIRFMERISFRLADHVIANNETSRHIAIERGGRDPEDITIVRNGPHLARDFLEVEPNQRVRKLGQIVVGYLGNMNPQDHLESFMEMARIIRQEYQMKEVGFVMVGSGDSFSSLQALRDKMGLTEAVLMTGRLPWPEVLSTLAATDICVQPDPPTEYTKAITMCKLLEYMALGKAVVAFGLPETQVSGGQAVTYAAGYSPRDLADAVVSLILNPVRCQALGRAARHRVETELAWEHQVPRYLDVYQKISRGA